MVKKKKLTPEAEKELKLRKLKKVYDLIDEELKLKDLPVIEQVHKLIDAANELQGEICQKSDDIKINDYEKAKEITPIDKKTYLDFVNICSLKNNDNLKEKAIDKFEEDFNNRLFITNLRHSFLMSYMDDKDLKITDEDKQEYVPYSDYNSDEFAKLMEESATKREYINLVLWRRYKNYAKAAEYITKGELEYKDFKNLVDWEHYKEGGYPTPNSPSKIWAIFDRFNYAHRLLTKWEYNDTSNKLKHEFGLNIEEVEPHPVKHPWMKDEDDEKEDE